MAVLLGARSNPKSNAPLAVNRSVTVYRLSDPPPVMVAVAEAGTDVAGPLKSTVAGSDPPSGMSRLRKSTTLSGGAPGVVRRVATKSMSPPGTSLNVTGLVEFAPLNTPVTPPNDIMPYWPIDTPATVPVTVFVGCVTSQPPAASSTSCVVDAYQTSVWYTSAKERGSAVVLPAATPARARFLARLRTGQTCL